METRKADLFRHYKGEVYRFVGIVQPYGKMPVWFDCAEVEAMHTETEETLTVQAYHQHGILTIQGREDILVFYQRVSDDKRFLRPIQMFFEYVHLPDEGGMVRRFTPIES